MATAAIAIAAAVAAAGVGAYGAKMEGEAMAGAAHYNAAIDRQNAAIMRANAGIAEESGQAQVGIQGQRTKAAIAGTTAQQAASGVDVNSGSYTSVRASERELGELDALNLRTNAAREAYGYKNKAVSLDAQSTLKEFEAENDITEGNLKAASTLLGGISGGSSQYQTYKMQGGLGGGGSTG